MRSQQVFEKQSLKSGREVESDFSDSSTSQESLRSDYFKGRSEEFSVVEAGIKEYQESLDEGGYRGFCVVLTTISRDVQKLTPSEQSALGPSLSRATEKAISVAKEGIEKGEIDGAELTWLAAALEAQGRPAQEVVGPMLDRYLERHSQIAREQMNEGEMAGAAESIASVYRLVEVYKPPLKQKAAPSDLPAAKEDLSKLLGEYLSALEKYDVTPTINGTGAIRSDKIILIASAVKLADKLNPEASEKFHSRCTEGAGTLLNQARVGLEKGTLSFEQADSIAWSAHSLLTVSPKTADSPLYKTSLEKLAPLLITRGKEEIDKAIEGGDYKRAARMLGSLEFRTRDLGEEANRSYREWSRPRREVIEGAAKKTD